MKLRHNFLIEMVELRLGAQKYFGDFVVHKVLKKKKKEKSAKYSCSITPSGD